MQALRRDVGEVRLLETDDIDGVPREVNLDVVALVLVAKPGDVPAAKPERPRGRSRHDHTSSTKRTKGGRERRIKFIHYNQKHLNQLACTLGGGTPIYNTKDYKRCSSGMG